MRTIYTTEEYLRIDGVEVLGTRDLTGKTREWVTANRRKLLRDATLPEKVTAEMLAKIGGKVVRQAFFLIRKRFYFLDFFLPERMAAVEIDGSVHKTKREHDRRRDADFRSIGIRTVRIRNKDVMAGKLYEKLLKGLYK